MIEYCYHPILGLQYFCCDPTLIIDVAKIPKGLSIEKFISDWKNYINTYGIDFRNSVKQLPIEIVSNFKYR